MKAIEGRTNGHYVPAMQSGNTLYISGLLSSGPGEVPGEDIKEEAGKAFAKLLSVLEKAGAAKEQVVQCRVYLRGLEHWDAVNEAYSEFFGAHRPSRVIVPVAELHYGSLVEVEAVAEVDG